MPREGTETLILSHSKIRIPMHLMPREGTETVAFGVQHPTAGNASYAP